MKVWIKWFQRLSRFNKYAVVGTIATVAATIVGFLDFGLTVVEQVVPKKSVEQALPTKQVTLIQQPTSGDHSPAIAGSGNIIVENLTINPPFQPVTKPPLNQVPPSANPPLDTRRDTIPHGSSSPQPPERPNPPAFQSLPPGIEEQWIRVSDTVSFLNGAVSVPVEKWVGLPPDKMSALDGAVSVTVDKVYECYGRYCTKITLNVKKRKPKRATFGVYSNRTIKLDYQGHDYLLTVGKIDYDNDKVHIKIDQTD